MAIARIGRFLYALHFDLAKGFLTWKEKGVQAIMLFTSGQKAERYASEVYPQHTFSVYRIQHTKAKMFVASMIKSNVTYALIDVPPEHADIWNLYEDEQIRNYAIVDLQKAFTKLLG